jgi:glycine dehydrogenase subunit 1
LHAHNILPGYELAQDYPELGDTLLVCATETRSDADIEMYAGHLGRIIQAQTAAGCPVKPKMA